MIKTCSLPMTYLCQTETLIWSICHRIMPTSPPLANEADQGGGDRPWLQMPSSGPDLPQDRLVLSWATSSSRRQSRDSISLASNRKLQLGPCPSAKHHIQLPIFIPVLLHGNLAQIGQINKEYMYFQQQIKNKKIKRLSSVWLYSKTSY